jgi:hypothetical protein
MKAFKSVEVIRSFYSMIVLALAFLAGPALAQGGFAKDIQGTWLLTSQYGEQDGKRVEPFGANPRGMMVITPEGRFSMMLMKASLPAFTSNNRVKGTPEENQAVVQGSVAYFGTYSIASEKDKAVTLRIDGSTFPNWDGQEQKRVMSVTGDEMNVTNPTAAIGGTSYVVWKRVK